jgi:NOL1/NOP2/fmu family ribosome biogenesis protein
MDRRQSAALLSRLSDLYGWDGIGFLEQSSLELWQRGPVIYLLPQSYLGQFAYFPVQSLGLVLGDDAPEGFIPSHEWVARFGLSLSSGICRLPSDRVAPWLRGEDIQGDPDSSLSLGATAIVQDEEGRLLGRGKILSARLKNLLPRRVIFS